MNITKALSDANRVRMLLALQHGELCACQLTELLGLAPSTMSKHLSILFQAQLVNSRKDGRWVYYALPGQDAPPCIQKALEWLLSSLAGHSQITADSQKLREVLQTDPTELCRRQCRA